MALFLPPLAGGDRRRAPLDFARERQRRAPHFAERPVAPDAHVDMDAARAGRLRPADQPQIVERGPDHPRHLADLRPLDARHRIEIHAQLVGMVEIVGAHRVRMQLEAGEVGHPQQRGGIARHDLVGAAAGRKAQRHHLDPRRARFRARASGRRTPPRCRWDSGPARWAVRPRRGARRPRPRGSSARDPAWCGRARGNSTFSGLEIATSRSPARIIPVRLSAARQPPSQSSAKRIGISARHAHWRPSAGD